MEIINFHLHHIDVNNNSVSLIDIELNPQNLNNYIEELLQEIITNTNKRTYLFKEGNTEVKTSLSKILDNNSDVQKIIELNAKRLLEKEIKVQELMRSKNMSVEIQKGSLLHLSFDINGTKQIIICKVEHDEILDESNFEKIRGLNTKKKVFKAILVTFDEFGNISENFVFDKYNSKYWWDDFLELQQQYTDSDNTKKTMDEVDKVISTYKSNYGLDHTILRNSVIGYYRSNDNFNYFDFLSDVIENYKPINTEFPKDKLIAKLKDLPLKRGFDTQFSIDKTSIKKRVNKIKLANNLFLNIEDNVENLENIIEPWMDEQGNKFLRIRTTEGYEYFKDIRDKK